MTRKDDRVLQKETEALMSRANMSLVVEVIDRRARITGQVDSRTGYQAVLDLVKSVEGIEHIEDEIEISMTAPDSAFADASASAGFEYAENPGAIDDRNVELEQDFAGDPGARASDFQESVEEAEPYFPPTDPVVEPDDSEQELEVIGGFEDTAMDELAEDPELDSGEEEPRCPLAGNRDDETIREDVLRELRDDALTTDL